MNKLPTKQIYLLTIIIVGIIALSVYSTYAIFTLESETSDIVSIHTPNSLEVSTNMYEYKQLTVPKNATITTDIDIYNTHEYELCYSIWYKVATKKIDETAINVYQNTDTSNTANSVIESMNSKRLTLIITNDNDTDVKVNIGLSSSKNEGTCELNLSEDKQTITSTLNNPKKLTDTIIENSNQPQTNESGYLVYKNQTKTISLENNIHISENFTYKDEVFTLTNSKEIELKDILNYTSDELKSYYTCLEASSCKHLYKINEIKKETNDLSQDYYQITNYDRYFGYLKGQSGIKKVTQNNVDNYIYYGDNPNNFIYYNCANDIDTKSCELWRIIGIFKDNEGNYITKIIKDETIGLYKYSDQSNNLWSSSIINKYLNKDYKLNDETYLKEIKYNQENILDLNITLDKITTMSVDTTSKINIMSLSDYLNASTCQDKLINQYDETCLNNNWLNKNNNLFEWTTTIKYLEPTTIEQETITDEELTTNEETTTEEGTTTEEITTEEMQEEQIEEEKEEVVIPKNSTVYTVGSTIKENLVTESLDVRPVVYLKNRILIQSGSGTLEDPYQIR